MKANKSLQSRPLCEKMFMWDHISITRLNSRAVFFNHRTFCKYKAVRFWLIFVLYLELYGAFKDFFNVFGHFA